MIRSVALIILSFCLLSGCASVFTERIQAFERKDLSRRGMELSLLGAEAPSVQHMLNAREGSSGGFGGAGGGCGCN